MKVLLVVDPQKDFCPGGSLAVQEGDKIFPLINELIRNGAFDCIVASMDWHPKGHVSFASSHPGQKTFDAIFVNGLVQMLWPDHCGQNTEGAEIHPALNAQFVQKIIKKGTDKEIDSYSAFFDNGGVKQTDLLNYLLEQAKKRGESLEDIELYVCGLATDYCVKFSALDAARLGISTKVIFDACRAVDQSPEGLRRVAQELREVGVELIEAREVYQTQGVQRLEREQSIAVGI